MDNGACSYRRFLNGDEEAFDEIVKEYFDSLVFFINGYVSDLHAAEDIAIDTLSDLVVNKKRYNFKVTLKTYLFMLAKSRAKNHIKHRNIIKFTDLDEAKTVTACELSLDDTLIADEKKRTLYKAIGTLSTDMRIAVYLIYFEEMSYDEAARVMKKSKKQVDNLLYRAKNQLRTILTDNGENI